MNASELDQLPPDPILQRREEIRAITARTLGRRTQSSRIFIALISLALIIALIPLVLVLFTIIQRGGRDLTWAFLTRLPQVPTIGQASTIGGIGNAIVGTLIVAGMAALMAIPLSLILGLYLVEMESRWSRLFRSSVEILSGIPSILLGVFAYIFIVIPQHHFSAFAASVALALLMTPVITKAVETAIRGVPDTVTEAGLALGARRSVVARKVVLPAARPGIITGTLLALARTMGETAPLLLVIGLTSSSSWDLNPFHSMSALPTLTYYYSNSAFPSQHAAAWGVALVLVLLVLFLNLTSRFISARLARRSQS
jgi:phosphate transport system permease protein